MREKSVTNPVNPGWAEVKCDFLNEDDGFWRVDAWKTADDAEEGRVIAYIDDVTGRIIYVDPLARVDAMAQEVIKDRIKNLGPTISVRRCNESIEASMPTKYGNLVAEFEFGASFGTTENELYIGLSGQDPEIYYFDIQSVRATDEGLLLYNWSDIWDEDCQQKFIIKAEDIRKFVSEETGCNEAGGDADRKEKPGEVEPVAALPKECTFPLSGLGCSDPSDKEELSDIISEKLSDQYGFCHRGFACSVDGDLVHVTSIEWDTTE